jgi:hypothetical protein
MKWFPLDFPPTHPGEDQLLAARRLDRARDARIVKGIPVERSMISIPGRASTSSGNVGPHMLSRAVVVATIDSLGALAALARATTLCFNSPVE